MTKVDPAVPGGDYTSILARAPCGCVMDGDYQFAPCSPEHETWAHGWIEGRPAPEIPPELLLFWKRATL